MPRKKPPELTFQQHIADYLVREHNACVNQIIKDQSVASEQRNYGSSSSIWFDYEF